MNIKMITLGTLALCIMSGSAFANSTALDLKSNWTPNYSVDGMKTASTTSFGAESMVRVSSGADTSKVCLDNVSNPAFCSGGKTLGGNR